MVDEAVSCSCSLIYVDYIIQNALGLPLIYNGKIL